MQTHYYSLILKSNLNTTKKNCSASTFCVGQRLVDKKRSERREIKKSLENYSR